jgi:hypothetical protein
VLVAALSTAPYVRAHLAPPPGRAFVGAFLFVEDIYNYLGYVQQAEDGAWLFRSKLTAEPHPAALINLEWWAAGRLSRLLGRSPLLAFRLMGLAAALAFVALADAWLRRAGLPGTHRLPALLLVCFGAGLGGALSGLGLARSTPIDLYTGLFPVIELLANPHFVIGTSLTMGALLALAHGSPKGTTAGVALAAAAGLTRPYDLVMIVAARGLAVALTEPPRRWAGLILPLAALTPVVAYMYWLVHHNVAFAAFQAERFPPPPVLAVLAALAPALALAALARGAPAAAPEARRLRTHLWAWAAAGLALIVLRPVPYALQFLAGIGVPLLTLGAVGLARRRPRATMAALAVLSSTLMAALWRTTGDDSRAFVPPPLLEAARALRGVCRTGDVVLAPPEIGLLTLAFSSCVPFVSHPAMNGYEERLAETRAFYGEWDGERRAAFLARVCPTVLVEPGAAAGYVMLRRPACAPSRPGAGAAP